ncbi:cupin domain-containing protein [Diaminobutyricimonas sp. LJ205]|uniref:cupin domain-containing protein n=1 Tax=Diaminobutyricimonas sp. LJ205 TaxID=2683590 RepID=UPI0012F51694|nr:cupin domain-containing protein [Diaminobutyricimonas sp. LJ205]
MTIPEPEASITVVADLLGQAPIEAGKLGHFTVLKSPDVRVVVLAFEAGFVMKEHAAPKTLLMQALDGELRVTAAERTVRLIPCTLIRMESGERHQVEAIEDSRLMLTLIG